MSLRYLSIPPSDMPNIWGDARQSTQFSIARSICKSAFIATATSPTLLINWSGSTTGSVDIQPIILALYWLHLTLKKLHADSDDSGLGGSNLGCRLTFSTYSPNSPLSYPLQSSPLCLQNSRCSTDVEVRSHSAILSGAVMQWQCSSQIFIFFFHSAFLFLSVSCRYFPTGVWEPNCYRFVTEFDDWPGESQKGTVEHGLHGLACIWDRISEAFYDSNSG